MLEFKTVFKQKDNGNRFGHSEDPLVTQQKRGWLEQDEDQGSCDVAVQVFHGSNRDGDYTVKGGKAGRVRRLGDQITRDGQEWRLDVWLGYLLDNGSTNKCIKRGLLTQAH